MYMFQMKSNFRHYYALFIMFVLSSTLGLGFLCSIRKRGFHYIHLGENDATFGSTGIAIEITSIACRTFRVWVLLPASPFTYCDCKTSHS